MLSKSTNFPKLPLFSLNLNFKILQGRINTSECELNDPQNIDGIPGPLYGGDYGPYGGEYGEGDGSDPCSEWDMKGFWKEDSEPW